MKHYGDFEAIAILASKCVILFLTNKLIERDIVNEAELIGASVIAGIASAFASNTFALTRDKFSHE